MDRRSSSSRLESGFALAVGIVFMLLLAAMQQDRAFRGRNDFVQFYVAAELAGTRDLYSRPANLAAVQKTLGFWMETVVYTRPPFYAVLLKPLSFLRYRVAYGLFSLATLATIVWFVVRFSKECSALPFFAAMSIPVLTASLAGQDTSFLVGIVGASILLNRKNMDFWTGLVLSLLAIKFHLFLFVPVLLLVKKRWRILSGGACGVLILAAVGLAGAGVDSMGQWIEVLRDPWINPSATIMPNLHGLVATLGGDRKMAFLLVAAVFLTFLWTCQRTDNYEFLFAASLVCGLLISFHSGTYDDVVLLPVFVLVIANCSAVPLRVAAGLILTPFPYFMTFADAPYSAFLPVALLLLIGLFAANGGAFIPLLPARSRMISRSTARQDVVVGCSIPKEHTS